MSRPFGGNGQTMTDIENLLKAQKPYQILALDLSVARTNAEFFPTLPRGWDVIAVVSSTNQTDQVTIRFPDKQSDGVPLAVGRKIRLKGGVHLPRFYLTNSSIASATMTIFIGGETGAEFDIAQAVEVVTSLPTRTSTATDGPVTVLTASATQILAANANRKHAIIQNVGANRIHIGIDNGIASGGGPYIDTGQSITFEYYTGAIWGIADTANTNVAFIETA